jgi:hypothetical protein
MECRDAQFYLRLKRHAAAGSDELGADVNASLDGHLATCLACAADAHTAASFDRAMASAMRSVPVPVGLRDQLIAYGAAKQGAILRGKLYRVATVAAAAVVLLFLGLGVISYTRPKLDTAELVQRNGRQFSESKQVTQEWLAAQKLPRDLPLPFDYQFLVALGKETVQGVDVPVVVFRNDTAIAKVYIIRDDGRLNPKDSQDVYDSFAGAKVIREQGVTYVIIHNAGPDGLRQFLITRNGGMPPAI